MLKIDNSLPLISIIIPLYNAACYVRTALDSLIAQTHTAIEVIVVNDGSTDEGPAIVAAYDESRIRLVHQDNQGAAEARNHGLSLAQGQFIQFFDADDYLSPEKLERQMKLLLNCTDYVSSCSWQPFIHEVGDLPFQETQIFSDLSPQEYFNAYLNHKGDLPTNCWLIPRTIALLAGPWDSRLRGNDDGEYFARVVGLAKGIKFASGPLVHYRRTPGSLSIRKTPYDVFADMLSLDLIVEIAKQHGVVLKNTGLADSYNTLRITSYPLSEGYLDELNERIKSYGGARREVILGGSAAQSLSRMIGWKLTRRIQLLARNLRGLP